MAELRRCTDLMAKNSLQGVVVFSTYEYIIGNRVERKQPSFLQRLRTNFNIPVTVPLHVLMTERAPVWAHIVAGVGAGLAQTAVMTVFDAAVPLFRTKGNGIKFPSVASVSRHALHHAAGYASLFGSYEAIRRMLENVFYNVLLSQEKRVLESLENHSSVYRWFRRERDGYYDITPVTMTTTLLAGGLAGQVHHVVRNVTADSMSKTLKPKRLVSALRRSLPTFWPTGLMFLAFEYGGLLAERMAPVSKTN